MGMAVGWGELANPNNFGVSFWGALVIEAALNGGCDVLFSEDMQDGRVIEGSLTIRNPFGQQ